jgi:hypothetical protein
MTAWRTTGRWCSRSWKPRGKPTTSSAAPTSMSSCTLGRCAGVKASSTQCCGGALDPDHRDVDLAAAVGGVAPDALAFAVQQHGQPGGAGETVRIGVQLDLDAVGKVLARLVDDHMPGRHQVQPILALKKEAAGPGQRPLPVEGADAGRRKQAGWTRVVSRDCGSWRALLATMWWRSRSLQDLGRHRQ